MFEDQAPKELFHNLKKNLNVSSMATSSLGMCWSDEPFLIPVRSTVELQSFASEVLAVTNGRCCWLLSSTDDPYRRF